MKDRIDQARWLAVLVATAIALYLCWLMLRPFLGVLAWAIVQVIVFKRFRRRVFLMTPVHHHFEMAAWSETKIIVRFWIASIVLALFTLVSLKLR